MAVAQAGVREGRSQHPVPGRVEQPSCEKTEARHAVVIAIGLAGAARRCQTLAMKAIFLTVLLVPGLAMACPEQDLSAERAPHFEMLAAAPDPAVAQRAADEIWNSWHTAPDAHEIGRAHV